MDIEANKAEQKTIAAEILNLWDCSNGNGDFEPGQKDELCYLANRLAELVEAANEWNAKTR